MKLVQPLVIRRRKARHGAALVEFAIFLPVLVLIVFGAIEASGFIFLKQSLHITAYEVARNATRDDATNGSAQSIGNNLLQARQIRGASIDLGVADITKVPRGTELTVRVSAPTASNTQLSGKFIRNRTLTATVVMVKE